MGKYPMQETIQGIDRDHRNFQRMDPNLEESREENSGHYN